ncbi:response regulator transcription factor [Parasediminibacterium paludis]|uniref:Response regulator transcription factor n=1 Tax=Parasediminibacterium paludis TaxID=908966 RepID=A0ABV8PVC6_9BACT
MENILNPKEEAILQLMLQGKQNKEIATQLYISLDTVKKHNTNIFKKLGVRNRNKAIIRMLKNKYLSI